MRRPEPSEFAEYYTGYVGKVPETDVVAVLESQRDELKAVAAAVPPERETYRYEEGKWSVRELFGHVADAERVFGFRAYCFARGEQAPLPSFDQDEYLETAGYDRRPLADLLGELLALREANLAVLRHLDEEAWSRVGTASGNQVTVRALAYIMAGHVRHHLGVLAAKYRLPA